MKILSYYILHFTLALVKYMFLHNSSETKRQIIFITFQNQTITTDKKKKCVPLSLRYLDTKWKDIG